MTLTLKTSVHRRNATSYLRLGKVAFYNNTKIHFWTKTMFAFDFFQIDQQKGDFCRKWSV